MKRLEILRDMQQAGIIAVVRSETTQEALKTVHAIVAGGVKGIELTFTVPGAESVIRSLSSEYRSTDTVIGAGTVLDAHTARIAILAGAEFIVSPSFDADVAKISNLYQVPYIPGIFTSTEVQTALEAGVDIVKLFPGSIAGPDAIREIHGPFPYVSIMPSGGINSKNLNEWKSAGALLVGVGGSLSAPAKEGDFAEVEKNAKELVQCWQS
ncbi:bifunctional 2-keto-4-hydroxyglutarate aldolase/2-keto-3-deoxy-6-phosphogluconate aldolase [Levilactobacillus sp. HBUAS70063]|uniref:bifunctional 2-keto-4-hydroxyglutarate aldolase/2-keto-3-deoxy-6-phosphogluconate aldolase n=1 Tax=Levilactobacillus sp. HBUAS70063 TaxID=3109359 RepID=UPI00313336DD